MTMGLALYLTWRATLSGLPDIGDPFDVAAFADPTVPDDRNAFTLYRRASAGMSEEPKGDGGYDWTTASESRRKWLLGNREALDLWRRGAERPEALYIPPRDLTFATLLPVIQNLRHLTRLGLLEASRLEDEGDLAAALGYHVAILRSGNHCGHRGVPIERLVGAALYGRGCESLTRWAANPRVDPPLLRRAIDGVLAADALTPTISEVLKAEYLCFRNSLDDPKLLAIELTGGDLPKAYHWPGGRAVLEDLPRLFRREPERSRRVVRLMFANWLSVCDLPADRRPPRATTPPKRSGQWLLNRDLLPELFNLDSTTAPASARAIPPAALARWWDTTLYARRFTPSFQTLIDADLRERAARAGLLIALGNELFRRDHGAYPTAAEELVGPYLKALPEGYVPPK